MKHLIDIHVVLATTADMEYWEDQAEDAADKLNVILHMVYDSADEDIDVLRLEKIFQHIWENWREDSYLLEVEEDDLRDWVDHLLATWDDADQEHDFEHNN